MSTVRGQMIDAGLTPGLQVAICKGGRFAAANARDRHNRLGFDALFFDIPSGEVGGAGRKELELVPTKIGPVF